MLSQQLLCDVVVFILYKIAAVDSVKFVLYIYCFLFIISSIVQLITTVFWSLINNHKPSIYVDIQGQARKDLATVWV